jgi:hypothetical protein
MFHLIIPVAMAVASAVAGLVALSYSTVQEWISQESVTNGYVDLIREKLTNGHYTIVAGAFSPTGSTVARKTWTNVKIDDQLRSHFGESNVFRIQT